MVRPADVQACNCITNPSVVSIWIALNVENTSNPRARTDWTILRLAQRSTYRNSLQLAFNCLPKSSLEPFKRFFASFVYGHPQDLTTLLSALV